MYSEHSLENVFKSAKNERKSQPTDGGTTSDSIKPKKPEGPAKQANEKERKSQTTDGGTTPKSKEPKRLEESAKEASEKGRKPQPTDGGTTPDSIKPMIVDEPQEAKEKNYYKTKETKRLSIGLEGGFCPIHRDCCRPIGASGPCPIHHDCPCRPVPPLEIPPESKTTGSKRRCASVCKFFGTLDEYHLLQWKTAFERKLLLGDVGVGLNKAFDRKYLFQKEPPEKDLEENEMKGGTAPQGEEATTGLDAYNTYSKLHKDEWIDGEKLIRGKERSIKATETLRDMSKKELNEARTKRMLREIGHSKDDLLRRRPWFTIILSFIQLVYLLVALGIGGVKDVGVAPQLKVVHDVETPIGLVQMGVWTKSNPWMGPSIASLITLQAVYGSCMRMDKHETLHLQKVNPSVNIPLGCCVIKVGTAEEYRNVSFPASQHNCKGRFLKEDCDDTTLADDTERLRPCCLGLYGRCRLVFESDCNAHGGHYSRGVSHCRDVNCFQKFCGSSDIVPHPSFPYLLYGHAQGWRWFLSPFLHAGIIHFVLVLIFQWLLLRCLETLVGWLRMAIMYIITVVGANIVGAYYEPYMPIQGSTPALFGVLGINILEIVQGWSNLKNPVVKLLVVLLVVVLFLFLGTLPLLNNFAHVGGLWFGVLTGIVVMPHLNFNMWTCRARRFLIMVSVLIISISFLGWLNWFYHVQDLHMCPKCNYFDCLPYKENMCDFTAALLSEEVDLQTDEP